MQEIGKLLVAAGIVVTVAGLFLWKLGGKLPLGRLPGDIYVQKPNFSFYFPIATCLLLSALLTLILWLARR